MPDELTRNEALIVCNECGFIVRTVPSAVLWQNLDEMELTLEVHAEMCPYCQWVNVLPALGPVPPNGTERGWCVKANRYKLSKTRLVQRYKRVDESHPPLYTQTI
jgi:hypothetical protein